MIHIFWHICTVNHWRTVVEEQLARLKSSGLYQAAESIRCCVVGSEKFVPEDKKLQVIYRHDDRRKWEWPTLAAMRDFCLKAPDTKILYFHTKGISLKGRADAITPARVIRSTDWRYLMEYFLIDRFQVCVDLLNRVDVCGVNFRGGGGKNVWLYRTPHFAGNFWWAKGSFIAGLPAVTPELAEVRTEAEFWVGHGEGHVACLFDSGINHCLSNYPRDVYVPEWSKARICFYRLKDETRKIVDEKSCRYNTCI